MYLINVIDPIAKVLGNWSVEVTFGSIIFRVCLAILLSFAVGIERSARNHAAGVRTYVLVTIGACGAMLTNQFLMETYGSGDSARLGAQVISGIGFLGAGAIMITSRSQIRGLTTAAGMWASACMGLTVGAGFYTLSVVISIAILVVLTILQGFEDYFKDRSKNFSIHIELNEFNDLKKLLQFIRKQNVSIVRVELNSAYQSSGLAVYTIFLCSRNGRDKFLHIPFIAAIGDLEYVNYVEEI